MHPHSGLIFAFLMLFAAGAMAETSTEALLTQSYEMTEAGRFEEALEILRTAAREEPKSSLIYTRIGGVEVLRQEYSAGIQAFQRAIMLDQRNAKAFIGMAVAYLHLGQYSLARAALEEAGRIDPAKQPEIDNVLSWIEQRIDDLDTMAH